MLLAEVMINNKKVLLIKPQAFMNSSGNVIPFLSKQGIKAENILVVHDELEQPFGKISFKVGGSARGHNGVRSIIAACGENFVRVRFGIGRPNQKSKLQPMCTKFFRRCYSYRTCY
jgi:PTH1 family peptidyl-tRNA hydrolase